MVLIECYHGTRSCRRLTPICRSSAFPAFLEPHQTLFLRVSHIFRRIPRWWSIGGGNLTVGPACRTRPWLRLPQVPLGKRDLHLPLRLALPGKGRRRFPATGSGQFPSPNSPHWCKVNGVQLISLQKGPGTEQLQIFAGSFPIVDLGKKLDEASGPFMDTAAVMKNLDLVISSDTAVAHLAGALGVPVWVGLPVVPDWRWLLEREDTPWYPTMRLFRQTRQGRWEDVFERITSELTKLVCDFRVK